MMNIELCAASESAVRLAVKYKFNRIELCQHLEVGGLTPSVGLQQFAINLIQTHVLIRPRSGDFIYSSDEKEVILKDISASAKFGAAAIVVGALTGNNELDVDFLKAAKAESKIVPLVIHKAFDEVKDWKTAMENLIALGYDGILTAGQARNVLEGLQVLKEMTVFANNKIKIIAGGGVNKGNILQLQSEVNPEAIHFSATTLQHQKTESKYAVERLMIDEKLVQETLSAINFPAGKERK